PLYAHAAQRGSPLGGGIVVEFSERPFAGLGGDLPYVGNSPGPTDGRAHRAGPAGGGCFLAQLPDRVEPDLSRSALSDGCAGGLERGDRVGDNLLDDPSRLGALLRQDCDLNLRGTES